MPSLSPSTPQFRTEWIDRLMIVWHGQGTPSNEAWDDALATLRAGRDRPIRVLVLTEGGGPTPQQQLHLTKVISARTLPLPVAVVSESTRVRFMASALALFTKRIRTFKRSELPQGIAFLELNALEARAAERFASRDGVPEPVIGR